VGLLLAPAERLWAKKKLLCCFSPFLNQFWCPVVTLVIFSSNLCNLEKNPLKPKEINFPPTKKSKKKKKKKKKIKKNPQKKKKKKKKKQKKSKKLKKKSKKIQKFFLKNLKFQKG
jgi:hypothetical protein